MSNPLFLQNAHIDQSPIILKSGCVYMDMPSYQGSGDNNNLYKDIKKVADLQMVHKSLESIQGADPKLPDSAHHHSGSIGDGDIVSDLTFGGVHTVAENQIPRSMTGSLRNGIRSLTEPLGREDRNSAETGETNLDTIFTDREHLRNAF